MDFESILRESLIFHLRNKPKNQKRMNSLESKFYKALAPLLMISIILNCVPIGLQKPIKRINHYYIYQKFLQILWGLIVYISIVLGAYHEYFLWTGVLPIVQLPFYLSEIVLYLLHVLQIMIVSYFGRKTFIYLLESIVDFDDKLKQLKIHLHYNDLRKFLRNHLFLNFAFFVCATTLGYIQRSTTFLGFLSINSSYTLPNVIIQTSLIQYYALTYVINKRMQLLYQLIDQLLKQSPKKLVFNVQQKLRFLRGLYSDIDEYTKHLNETFSISILLYFMSSYAIEWAETEFIWMAYAIVEICVQFARVFLLLHYNQGVQNQKKRATVLFTSFRYVNERLEPTIGRFITQLSADPRNHIICGIIPLKMNVMMAMFVMVSTLFIFLVQYDITYEALINAGIKHEHIKL
uniref:Gustatory receptor n=1 Tax=Glossina austeni TaxID=7395 RepID=A0A1A9VCB1_GLOAU